MTTTIPSQERHYSRSVGVVLALAAIVCCVLLPAPAFANGRHARPLYWGASIGSQLTGTAAPWDMSAVSQFERLTGKGLSLIAFSSPFSDCGTSPCSPYGFPAREMEDIRNYGAIPFFSWGSQSTPASLNEPEFQLSDVINGTYDPYIRSFAEAAREWGHPFFLRLDPEMNGFWFPWSEGVNGNKPGQFVAAWRHVHDIFASVGATNATWVWCPNVDFNRALVPLHGLYPGGAYVNWTCLDGFNWGATANSAGWQSVNRIFRSTYRRVHRIAPGKPMIIGEVASDERGGSKLAWIRNLLQAVPSRYRMIRGLIWFDVNDQGMRWPIESSRAAIRAFAHGIQRKVYRPNLYASLADRPIRPPSW